MTLRQRATETQTQQYTIQQQHRQVKPVGNVHNYPQQTHTIRQVQYTLGTRKK